MAMSGLEPAPARLIDKQGRPAQGRFAGHCLEIDWSRLAPPLARSTLWRWFHHKRWHYVGITHARWVIGCAIVDVGWTNTAFAYCFDRETRQLRHHASRDGLPGLTARVVDTPGPDAVSRFAHRGLSITLASRNHRVFELTLRTPDGLRAELHLEGDATPWLFATGPVESAWHSTHKSPALAVTGEIIVAGERHRLDDAHASIDHSNGLLPRETRWHWASAHRPGLGFNLQAGYFGDHENGLWLDGQLIALGPAHFEVPTTPDGTWRMHTACGKLDLRFTPEGERAERKQLVVAASIYRQPIGRFDGWVRSTPDGPLIPVNALVGVTEEHFSRW
jgi:hypothetical protein